MAKPKDILVTLGHELVHMFDHCRAHVDFSNIHHLACTEVRAANLMHCQSHKSDNSDINPTFSKANTQKECVKRKAVLSICAIKSVEIPEAHAAVEAVFDRCYNDMEPFGQHFQFDTPKAEYIYQRRRNYGYY